jgi:hypothetical protein
LLFTLFTSCIDEDGDTDEDAIDEVDDVDDIDEEG